MAGTVFTAARQALAEVLLALASQQGWTIHVLDGPPQQVSDLPAVSISFPAFATRPLALGGHVGERPRTDGSPATATGMRLEGTLRLDLWVGQGKAKDAAEAMSRLEGLTRLVSEGLLDAKLRLRRSGVLKLELREMGPAADAQAHASWIASLGDGRMRSATYGLVFEATFVPEEVEGVIREIDVRTKAGVTEERFKAR